MIEGLAYHYHSFVSHHKKLNSFITALRKERVPGARSAQTTSCSKVEKIVGARTTVPTKPPNLVAGRGAGQLSTKCGAAKVPPVS